MYCWKNGTVPASPAELAKLLRISDSALRKPMNNGMTLFMPDLEAYRQGLIRKRGLKSENGKKGIKKRWGDAENGKTIANGMSSDMNRTDYNLDDGMNEYLTRSLN